MYKHKQSHRIYWFNLLGPKIQSNIWWDCPFKLSSTIRLPHLKPGQVQNKTFVKEKQQHGVCSAQCHISSPAPHCHIFSCSNCHSLLRLHTVTLFSYSTSSHSSPAPQRHILLLLHIVTLFFCSTLSHSSPVPRYHILLLLHTVTFFSCATLSHSSPAPYCHILLLPHTVTFFSCPILSHSSPAPQRHILLLLHIVL